MYIKIFFRSRLRVFLFTLIVVCTVIYNLYILSFDDVNLKVGPLNAFLYQEQIAYYLFLAMLFLSFDYYREYKDAVVLERITSSTGKIRHTMHLLVNMHYIVILYSVIIWAFGILTWNNSGLLNKVTCLYLTKNIFLFFFMTGVLASLLSLCVSYFVSNMWGYVLLFIFALLFGPLVDYSLQILSGMFGQGTSLIYVFNIFPGISSTINPFVAITGNMTTFARTVMWITAILLLIMIRIRYKKIIPLLIVSVMFVLSGVIIIRPDYSYNNSTPITKLSSVHCNSEYYLGNHPEYNEDAGFRITGYDMKLRIDSMLNADVLISMEENDLTEYKFTLQHMYKINEIVDDNGNTLNYNRTGDYLIICSEKPLTGIRIKYCGGNPEFYSSYDQVFLPGFFPYYPVAGYRIIFDSSEFKYVDNSYEYPVLFNVRLTSISKVYSNLHQNDEGTFTGYTVCPVFISGFVEDKTINGISCVNQYLAKENSNEALYMDYFIDYVTRSMREEGYSRLIFIPTSGLAYPSIDDGFSIITNNMWFALAYNYNANRRFTEKAREADVSEDLRIERFKWAYNLNKLDEQSGYDLYYSFYQRFMLDNSEESEKNFEMFFKTVFGNDEWNNMKKEH